MKPITPRTLKRLLEKCGYLLVAQDDCCWIMENNGHPAVISQTMDLVPLDMLETILEPAGIDEKSFVELVAAIENPPAAAAS